MRDQLSFNIGATFQLVLRLTSTETDAIEVRGMTKEGPFVFTQVPNGTGTPETFTFNIPDIPIGVSVALAPGIADARHYYGQLFLNVNGNRLFSLAQGSIGVGYSIAWPHQLPITDPQLFGPPQSIEITTPAAGEEVGTNVPNGQYWELLGIRFRLVTDANAADRTVQLQLGNIDAPFVNRTNTATIQANETTRMLWLPNGTTAVLTANELHEIALPMGIFIPAGGSIITVTTNIQAGDQYDEIIVYARRRFLGV
jgi:hypothetical protein